MAGMEFALVLPLLLVLCFGGFELSRFILISHKLEKAAYTVTDVVAQQTSITTAQLGNIMSAASEIMQPYDFRENGVIVLSSVYQSGSVNPPTVKWQYTGGGSLSGAASKVGYVGGYATLPSGLTLADKDNVILAEVFYKFSPVFAGDVITPSDIYKTVVFKPRLGSLTTPPN